MHKSGFYKVKAARIKEVSRIISEDYMGKVPVDFDELISLPGVGAKTANCVLLKIGERKRLKKNLKESTS